jgi:cephalosporin hydroxylase
MLDLRDGIRAKAAEHKATIDAFHQLWYGSPGTWGMTAWQGRPLLKCPTDLWVYQEIVHALRPTLIVETGTAMGGSALYFSHLLDLTGDGAVVSVDIEPAENLPTHPRCTFVTGSSIDPQIVDYVKGRATGQRVMVVLDSDHSMAHVLSELDAYGPLVTDGQFLVIEDTNINGRPMPIDWKGGPGPGPAVDAWLPLHPEFAPDILAERHYLTMHPGGWLRRMTA